MAMEQEEWQALVARPEWRKFEQYLRDWRIQLMESIAEGQLPLTSVTGDPGGTVVDAIARCQVYKDLTELEWQDIAKFYYEPTDKYEEEDNDSTDVPYDSEDNVAG